MIDVFDSDCSNLTFESIELLPLETLPDVLIGGFNQLKINYIENDIYISNLDNKEEIFRFNKQGKFLNTVGKQGGGPKEFSSHEDICAHGDTVDVLFRMGDKIKIQGYRNDGAFLYSKSVNLIAHSFEWLSPGYIFETSYSKIYPFRIYTTDEKGKITNSFLPNSTGFAMASVENNFSRLGTKVYCKEGYNNEVYIAENNELNLAYKMDLGAFKVPDEYYKKNPMQAFQFLMARAFASLMDYFETPSYAFFSYRQSPKPNCDREDIFVLEKATNKLMKRSFKMLSEDFFKNPVVGTSKDEIVFLIYPYSILGDEQAFKSLPLKNPEIIKKLKVDDNPVLAFCKIK